MPSLRKDQRSRLSRASQWILGVLYWPRNSARIYSSYSSESFVQIDMPLNASDPRCPILPTLVSRRCGIFSHAPICMVRENGVGGKAGKMLETFSAWKSTRNTTYLFLLWAVECIVYLGKHFDGVKDAWWRREGEVFHEISQLLAELNRRRATRRQCRVSLCVWCVRGGHVVFGGDSHSLIIVSTNQPQARGLG